MSRNYKFHNELGLYFVSFAVVNWLDVFIRNEYKEVLIKSLKFCQENKGMEVFAWCIMSSHVHLVFRSIEGQKPELLLGDFKRFTSKELIKAIIENPKECRKENLLKQFEEAGAKSSNVKKYQFWRHDNKPIELWTPKVIKQKIDYIHNNPVVEGIVFEAHEYKYSSAVDYCGGIGMLDNICIFEYFEV